jgi:hypothetical protein
MIALNYPTSYVVDSCPPSFVMAIFPNHGDFHFRRSSRLERMPLAVFDLLVQVPPMEYPHEVQIVTSIRTGRGTTGGSRCSTIPRRMPQGRTRPGRAAPPSAIPSPTGRPGSWARQRCRENHRTSIDAGDQVDPAAPHERFVGTRSSCSFFDLRLPHNLHVHPKKWAIRENWTTRLVSGIW